MITQETIDRAETATDYARSLVTLCRATGGYKFRKLVHASDVEIDKQCEIVIPKIFEICVKLAIAEDMLERGPLNRHSNIIEYEERFRETMAELAKRSGKKS